MNPANPAADQDYSAGYKRVVLLMLTIDYTSNVIDRQFLVILQEPVKAEMGLSAAQLSLLSGFAFAYWADALYRDELH